MAHSVEARLPFCDPHVVDYALSLPQEAVRTGKSASQRKAILSKAYAGLLPQLVTDRDKVAFQTGLGLSKVIPLADPARFYRAEYKKLYG
jgi:asparagine synthase (glutamine-hydrolysing)